LCLSGEREFEILRKEEKMEKMGKMESWCFLEINPLAKSIGGLDLKQEKDVNCGVLEIAGVWRMSQHGTDGS